MEAILNNERVPPGDETQFMHAAFTSEEEMMTFYLILNRFVASISLTMMQYNILSVVKRFEPHLLRTCST